jgi:hypothetical protein
MTNTTDVLTYKKKKKQENVTERDASASSATQATHNDTRRSNATDNNGRANL